MINDEKEIEEFLNSFPKKSNAVASAGMADCGMADCSVPAHEAFDMKVISSNLG